MASKPPKEEKETKKDTLGKAQVHAKGKILTPSDQPHSKKEAKSSPTKEVGAKRPASISAPKRNPIHPRTYFAKPGQVAPKWRLVDASGHTLGRLSAQVAHILMGKDKPAFTRSTDVGDFVVVVNAKKILLTGKKLEQKVYQYHTNYPGGLKTHTAKSVMLKHPERLVELAVYRMLPRGHMGRRWFKKLKVYPESIHPHAAQNPQPMKLLTRHYPDESNTL